MIPTLTSALRQIRDDLANLLEPLALGDLCRSLGCRWRERILDPVTTIHLVVLQILHGNTACTHLPRLTGQPFTASAYCQARSRLPLVVLQALLRRLVETCRPLTETVGLWHVGPGQAIPLPVGLPTTDRNGRAVARPPHLAC